MRWRPVCPGSIDAPKSETILNAVDAVYCGDEPSPALNLGHLSLLKKSRVRSCPMTLQHLLGTVGGFVHDR